MALPPQLQAQKEHATVTPQQLFEEALPKTFETFKEQAAKVSSTFQVLISGEGGGEWFIDPSNGSVEAGRKDGADCVLEMGVQEFNDLTAGKLDAGAAVKDGKMRFSGDPAQLVALGALLGG
jgi:putative sterol carrier protein